MASKGCRKTSPQQQVRVHRCLKKAPAALGALFFILFLSTAGPAFTEERIAMVDFVVHSDNPQYSFLGKGISEMIAVELSKSPEITLVDREKRVELMQEVKFALSGLAENREEQMQVGRMLSADYLVFGEIVDMPPQLL